MGYQGQEEAGRRGARGRKRLGEEVPGAGSISEGK